MSDMRKEVLQPQPTESKDVLQPEVQAEGISEERTVAERIANRNEIIHLKAWVLHYEKAIEEAPCSCRWDLDGVACRPSDRDKRCWKAKTLTRRSK